MGIESQECQRIKSGQSLVDSQCIHYYIGQRKYKRNTMLGTALGRKTFATRLNGSG